jgi:hypothetical protein
MIGSLVTTAEALAAGAASENPPTANAIATRPVNPDTSLTECSFMYVAPAYVHVCEGATYDDGGSSRFLSAFASYR